MIRSCTFEIVGVNVGDRFDGLQTNVASIGCGVAGVSGDDSIASFELMLIVRLFVELVDGVMGVCNS